MLLEHLETERLCDVLMESLGDSPDPVAIHAGHFYLASDGTCSYPLFLEELELQKNAPPSLLRRAREEIGIFPLLTVALAMRLCQRLQGRGSVFTLVNDWGDASIRGCAHAGEMRRTFYQKYSPSQTLEIFHRYAAYSGVKMNPLLMGPHHCSLLSELWLRRCFAKRMKKLQKRGGSDAVNQYFEGITCPVVTRGRVTCAGEVAELLLQLRARGFTRLVNFYPRVCGGYVKASTDIARELGLEEMRALHVGLSCAGESSAAELLQMVDLTIHT